MQTAAPQSVRDWSEVRKAFIESEEKPTYQELSVKFSIPMGTISVTAADQGWVAMRARRLEMESIRGDAADLLIQASKGETLITSRFRSVVLVVLQSVEEELAKIGEVLGVAAKMELLQTASFAMLNCGNALKAAGMVGMPKILKEKFDAGEETNGPGWQRGMLNALNVTINAGKGAEVSIDGPQPKRKRVETDLPDGLQSVDSEPVSTTTAGK